MADGPGKYLVGYGKPPVDHRFTKGRSGNPGGRPKGARNKPVNTGLGMRAAEEFLRIEAYRPIAIREGENIIELPAIQAVFRAMGVAALKGNRLVQKHLTEMVTRMEDQDHQSRMALFGSAIDFKQAWEGEFERCRKSGLPEPAPIPHPDDVVLDPHTGGVKILGPQTAEQKVCFDHAIERRTQAQEDVDYFAAKYRRARGEKTKARWLQEWHREQRMFDTINDLMSERYKAKLENRSHREATSHGEKVLDELQTNRGLKQDHTK